MKNVLIVDDEKITLRALRTEFTEAGYNVTTAVDGEAGAELIRKKSFDLVLLDMQLPRKNGFEVLKECHSLSPDTIVIMITAFSSVENAVAAMQAGASDYITKPYDIDDMLTKAKKLLLAGKMNHRTSAEGLSAEANPIACKAVLLGDDPQILCIKDTINKIKDISTSVMLTGESGTGKGIVAKHIHYLGNRASQPFIHINCAAIPENLIESELFGHEKGLLPALRKHKKGNLSWLKRVRSSWTRLDYSLFICSLNCSMYFKSIISSASAALCLFLSRPVSSQRPMRIWSRLWSRGGSAATSISG